MAESKKNDRFSRRGFLGTSLVIPFLSMTQTPSVKDIAESEDSKIEDEYTTLLSSSGRAVRVKKNTFNEAKVVQQKMSNKSLLEWLKLKDKN